MIELIRQLILAEVKIAPEIVDQICRQAVPKPHYDLVYSLTYNQADPKTEDLIELLEEYGLGKGHHIMEIMAGNGYESRELAKSFPDNHYSCLDKDTYFTPFPGLNYLNADCTDIHYRHAQQQDLIFIGSGNASMCMLTGLKEIMRLGIFLQNNVRLAGLAVLSYFEEHDAVSNFIIDYSVKAINSHSEPAFNGLYAHWFSAVKFDVEKQLHHYHDLVALSYDDELNRDSTYAQVAYHEKPFIARSWQTAIVMEIMQTAGFEYVGNKWNPDCRFMPFKKVENKAGVDYLGG
ncbi:hypothetical protein ACS5PU_10970 [Pedobacter sp. GSP4]|uniref:hypothetical protein n=1 Tax=Pedobacter sp. GSP4 TaxID=3453716 RepID=UPI003EF04D8F